jgi:PKD repeat protein
MAIFQKKTWGVFFIVSLIFLIGSRTWANSTPHFSFTSTPASAFFTGNLTVGGQGPAAGDEVAVFDSAVTGNQGCIGAVVISSTMAAGGVYTVATYGDDDPETPERNGAVAGDAVTFKLWSASDGKYYDLVPVDGSSVAWPTGTNPLITLNLKSNGGGGGGSVVAYFTSAPAASQGGCAPLSVQFTDASTGGATGWSWNFGDGTAASTVQSPSHTFSQAGSYTVTLTVTGAGGATNSSSQSIAVWSAPVADFTMTGGDGVTHSAASAISGNKPLSVNFTDTSTYGQAPATPPTGTSWSWNFGDGTASSTTRNPSHTFSTQGTYTVTLTVTDACGTTAKQSAAITVAGTASGLMAKIAASTLLACAAEQIKFSAAESTGDPVGFKWDFGDKSPVSTDKEPLHAYQQSGLYTVTLTVKNSQGEEDVQTQKNWVHINAKPIADFSVDKTVVCPGDTVNFTDLSTGDPIRWRWLFGDGWVSTQANPTHKYEKPGNYVVRLISSSMCGVSLEQKTAYIEVKSPSVDFDSTQEGDCNHLTVNFVGKSPDGDEISNCRWKFGDGSVGTGGGTGGTGAGNSVAYTYPRPGKYSVTLTANTPCGEVATTKDVVVEGPLVADFAFSMNPGTVTDTIQFIDKSTGGPTSWQWEFGDSNNSSSNLPGPTFRYGTAGVYTVTMTVSNDCGSKTTSRNIVIGAEGTSVIGVESTVCANVAVTFLNASPAIVTVFQWDFGDGTLPSTDKSPSHIFAEAGSYMVTLTAGGATYTRLITVRDKPTISVADDGLGGPGLSGGCAPLTVHFESNAGSGDSGSTGSAWLWDFGDGKESTEQNPVHTYMQEGNYKAVLKTDCGLSNTVDVVVKATLQADFTATTQLSGKAPLQVTFQNQSIGTADGDYDWEFGDGESSTEKNPPQHTYTRAGSYKVYLIVNNGQCEDEKSVWVDVYTLNSIMGKVLNSSNNEAIPEAQVQIVGENLSYTAGSDGSYAFTGLRPGSYALLVSAPGYESRLFQQVRITLGKDTSQNLKLTPQVGSLSGTITGSTSAGDSAVPIEGATVAVVEMGGATQIGPDCAHRAVTDAEGKYTIYLGHEGSYKVIASREGYVSKTDSKEGQGYEINFSTKTQTVDMTLTAESWRPKVTISSREIADSGQAGNGKQIEIYIYPDANTQLNFPDVTMSAANDTLGGDFSSASAAYDDSNHPCYKIIYSGYSAADSSGEEMPGQGSLKEVMASIVFMDANNQATVSLPYAFPVALYGSAAAEQEKCLKRVGRLLVPAQGGLITGMGWVDLNGDGQKDLYDDSYVEIPMCTSYNSQVIADSPVIACLDRLSNATLNSLSALYRVELMDPNGYRIKDTDLSIKEENPLIVHLHFNPATFEGSMGDLVVKYLDPNGTWRNGTAGGLKNIHLNGSNLVFTTTHVSEFGLFAIDSTPINLVLTQDPTSLSRLGLIWKDNALQEVGYEVWRGVDVADKDIERDIKYDLLTNTIAANETQYEDGSCQLGKSYSYKVRAMTELGATAFSRSGSLKISECESIPLAPRDLKVTSVSKNQVELAWTNQSACESGFTVYRKDGDKNDYNKIGTVTGFNYTDAGVKPGCTYYYKVSAVSDKGESILSDELEVTTAKKSKKDSGGMCFISSTLTADWAGQFERAAQSAQSVWSALVNWALGK